MYGFYYVDFWVRGWCFSYINCVKFGVEWRVVSGICYVVCRKGVWMVNVFGKIVWVS